MCPKVFAGELILCLLLIELLPLNTRVCSGLPSILTILHSPPLPLSILHLRL